MRNHCLQIRSDQIAGEETDPPVSAQAAVTASCEFDMPQRSVKKPEYEKLHILPHLGVERIVVQHPPEEPEQAFNAIMKIVRSIESIAQQANMLALYCTAVEPGEGEFGGIFESTASKVQHLALQFERIAKELRELNCAAKNAAQ